MNATTMLPNQRPAAAAAEHRAPAGRRTALGPVPDQRSAKPWSAPHPLVLTGVMRSRLRAAV
ncbi:hypothetical protein ACWC5I_28640, partial [Kitasatospora sp. NPDC001574]